MFPIRPATRHLDSPVFPKSLILCFTNHRVGSFESSSISLFGKFVPYRCPVFFLLQLPTYTQDTHHIFNTTPSCVLVVSSSTTPTLFKHPHFYFALMVITRPVCSQAKPLHSPSTMYCFLFRPHLFHTHADPSFCLSASCSQLHLFDLERCSFIVLCLPVLHVIEFTSVLVRNGYLMCCCTFHRSSFISLASHSALLALLKKLSRLSLAHFLSRCPLY